MASEPKTVEVEPGSEVDRLLDEAARAPLRLVGAGSDSASTARRTMRLSGRTTTRSWPAKAPLRRRERGGTSTPRPSRRMSGNDGGPRTAHPCAGERLPYRHRLDHRRAPWPNGGDANGCGVVVRSRLDQSHLLRRAVRGRLLRPEAVRVTGRSHRVRLRQGSPATNVGDHGKIRHRSRPPVAPASPPDRRHGPAHRRHRSHPRPDAC